MALYKNNTIKEYLDVLSKKAPVPGGGSAAAVTGAMGAALISMVASYSLGKGKSKAVEQKIKKVKAESKRIEKRMLTLVDLDAKAYMKVVKYRKKDAKTKKKALKEAGAVPRELCKLCYKAIQLMPYLVKNGNPYLMSDIEIACEMLLAAFNSSIINMEINK